MTRQPFDLARYLVAVAPDRVRASEALDRVQPILAAPAPKAMPAKAAVRRVARRSRGR